MLFMTYRSLRPALALAVLATSLQGQKLTKPAVYSPANEIQNPLQAFSSFSAILNGGLGRDTDRKIYRSGKLMRLDFEDHYRLVDLERLTTRFVYPDRCRMIGFPDAGSYPFSAYHGFKVERSPTAETDIVDNHRARIDNLTLTSTSPDHAEITIKMKVWEAEDLSGFPVKTEIDVGNERKFTVSYTNVRLVRPDPALFKVPPDCMGGKQGGWSGTGTKRRPR
jgi:hypothetical protein